MTKAELRKIYLAEQRSLSPFESKRKSERITVNFFRKFDLNGINFLHCFAAIEKFNEIDTSLIFQRLWLEFPQITTLLPRVNFQTGEIENLKYTEATKLVKNIWEIREPDKTEMVETEKVDMILIPLLCFDSRGFRVGYGKGFYDRLLKNCRADCLKIGLSYFAPVAEITDAQDFDVKPDFFVTP